MKKSVFAVILGLIAASAVAKDIKIERFRYPGGCQRLAAEGCVQLIEGGKTTIGRRFSVIERAAVGRRAVRQCLARSDADRAAEAAGIDEVGGVAQAENYIFFNIDAIEAIFIS